ncbi:MULTISPECIES: hypothetical protein [unclassified Sphingomonas]|uniref:hypothetical protein n=1 Tax=unclassified Sphingomonas TaxID=196159 RepID=UPI00226A8055|nr:MULTISPECIES: hypothetical protein [unclassified Sphingomonas]
MGAFRHICIGLGVLVISSLGACYARSGTVSDIQRYTSIVLCPNARIQDLTTQDERDTTPGFSFHAKLKLDAACAMSFERQLALVAPTECVRKRVHSGGCYALGKETKTASHTTIIARAIGSGVYDLRFFE